MPRVLSSVWAARAVADASKTNSLYLMCSQCLAETDNPAWQAIWATTIYKGYALCMEHFVALRARETGRSG